MRLYRLRSTNSLLGKYNELLTQTIYFAPPHEFNDPLEGAWNVIFKGDKIVWENMFRHFLLCMEYKAIMSMLHTQDTSKQFYEQDFPIFSSVSNLPTEMYKDFFKHIEERFFSYAIVYKWIKYLGSKTTALNSKQLLGIFYLISVYALESILFIQASKGLINNSNILESLTNLTADDSSIPDIAKNVAEDSFDAFLDILSNYIEQQNFQFYLSMGENAKLINWSYFIHDFPSEYIKHLPQLVYPNWYAAAFMGAFPTDISLWGHYADSSKGVCLIFDAKESDRNPYIEVERPTGFSSKDGIAINYSPIHFEKVRYDGCKVETSFFNRLWNQPRYIVENEWYKNRDLETSPLINELNYAQDKSIHSAYVNDLRKIQTTKTKEWEVENEYRLLLESSFFDFSTPQKRVLKYDFSYLTGIVFGINISKHDKANIIKIIQDKCSKYSRSDFLLYQARYDEVKMKIVKDRVTL